jgi:LAO/AO transport system kinase
MLVCEAAGYDVIFVETVGVGQSETAVAAMVDVFVLLQLPHAGDELQAIKRGIVELADIVVINKADIDRAAAERAQHQFAAALALLRAASPHWRPPVIVASAANALGIDALWTAIEHFRKVMAESGDLQARRRRQAVDWMWTLIDCGLNNRFRQYPPVAHDLDEVCRAVAEGRTTATAAAHRLLGYLDARRQDT